MCTRPAPVKDASISLVSQLPFLLLLLHCLPFQDRKLLGLGWRQGCTEAIKVSESKARCVDMLRKLMGFCVGADTV